MEFFVPGDPVTQGSMRAFQTNAGRPYVTHVSGQKLTAWRDAVAMVALGARRGRPFEGPVELSLQFALRRPKKPQHPEFPCAKGRNDADKLLRGVSDALSGIAYIDDGQVVEIHVTKRWAEPGREGVTVRVVEIVSDSA